MSTQPGTVGIVVIGRNEGARLQICLTSVLAAGKPVVYVDSASSDDSATRARALGVTVVEMDRSQPTTAAGARNQGYARLMQDAPATDFVQFVDGDCELIAGWIEAAAATLLADASVAAVCGRLRERNRAGSVYNRLCDIEWSGPLGSIQACVGTAMLRAERFAAAGGFNPGIIAAEDDELCVRLRLGGGKIIRIAQEMAWHDAAMTRFSQWWRRALRAGHAFAQVHALHGSGPTRHFRRETRRIWFWGLLLPLAILLAGALTGGWAWFGAAIYPLNTVRIAFGNLRRGLPAGDAWIYAVACAVSVFPALLGMLKFHWNGLRGTASRIIEYKRPLQSSDPAARD